MKMLRLVGVVAALGLFACGGEKTDATEKSNATSKTSPAGDGIDHCANLLKVGTAICNGPDVKKYGGKFVTTCLTPYQDVAKAGNAGKCKLMTPKAPK